MIKNDKKIINYVLLNTNTLSFKNVEVNLDSIKKTNTFNIDSYLKSMNNKWYNVYYILNDFYKDRTEKNLIWFNEIWLDIDIEEDFDDIIEWQTLEDILDNSMNLLWFQPHRVNKTYKGYHLFYKLSKELYELNKDDYKDIFKVINESMNWDPLMKSITSILKVEWYIDHKKDRRCLITNIYKNKENIITKNDIQLLLSKNIILDTSRKNKIENKISNKKILNSKIEEIDALKLIDKINKETKYHVSVSWNNIDKTWWLKLYKENDKYTIKDFAGWNRFWIKYFILNHILKDVLDTKEKMIEYNKILSLFWIKLRENYIPTKFPLYYLLWFKKDEIVDEINDKILNTDKWLLLKVMIWHNYLSQSSKSDEISEKDIIDLLQLSNSSNSRNKVKKAFIKLSYLKIKQEILELNEETWQIINIEQYKNIIDLEIITRNKQRFYKIKLLKNINNFKLININLELLKIKQDNKFITALFLTSNLEKSWKYKVKIEELQELLWIKSYDNIRDKFLTNLKKEKYIKNYLKEWDYIIYY